MALTKDERGLPNERVQEAERGRSSRGFGAVEGGGIDGIRPTVRHGGGLLPARGSRDLAEEEWRAHDKLHKYFIAAGKLEKPKMTGLENYRRLRPLYIAWGFKPNPLAELESKIVTFSWFGERKIPMHRNLRDRLRQAQERYFELRQGSKKPFTGLSGSFSPRNG